MDKRIRASVSPLKTAAALVLTVFILGSVIAPAAALDLPASTFLPFDGQQTLDVKAAGEKALYPRGSNFLLVSEHEDIVTGAQDIKVQMLDASGKEMWSKIYELPGNDTLKIMHMDKDGFVMGVSSRDGSKNTIRLVKAGSNGEEIWKKDLPLKEINSIANTNDDGLIIAGSTGENDRDIRVIKMNKDGVWSGLGRNASQWMQTFSQSGDQRPGQVLQVLDKDEYNDGYILAGYTDNNTNGKKDLYVMRLNAYGEIKWARNHGGSLDETGVTVAPVEDGNDEIVGFLIAGNGQTAKNGQDVYIVYLDKYGYQRPWPGYQRIVDGLKERYFGTVADEYVVSLTAAPKGFKENRKSRGKDIEGEGGAVLVVYTPEDKSITVIRINEHGQVLWERNMPIPGNVLVMPTLTRDEDNSQDLLCSLAYPAPGGLNMEVHTLQVYLEGVLDDSDDKTVPQSDQELENNREAVRWLKTTLPYAALRDIGKELKELLAKQPIVPNTGISGRGDIDWPDTSYYLGNLLIGKADGEGTLAFPNGIWYQGAWKDNMFNGSGYLRFPTGENYTGDFKYHMMNGSGVFKWPTGEVYAGEFKNNLKHGEGIMKWPGGVEYEGEFAEGQAAGKGVIRWPNGERYEGDMAGGSATGKGKYFFPSGEWYEGEFSSLTFSGVGVYHWPSGACYVGQFEGDRLNGEGYYIWPNGVQQWGYWKDDRYAGTAPEAIATTGSWKK